MRGTITTGAGEIWSEGEKQCDGEDERCSGGGEEARGKPAQSPPSLCSIGVSAMLGSHFDVQTSLCAEIQD